MLTQASPLTAAGSNNSSARWARGLTAPSVEIASAYDIDGVCRSYLGAKHKALVD